MEHGRRIKASLTTEKPKLNGQVGERPIAGGRCKRKMLSPYGNWWCKGIWVPMAGGGLKCHPCGSEATLRTANGYDEPGYKPKAGGRCKWYDPWTKKKCIGKWVVTAGNWRCDPCQQMSGFEPYQGLNTFERGVDNLFNFLGL